jgi:hypothetical protein
MDYPHNRYHASGQDILRMIKTLKISLYSFLMSLIFNLKISKEEVIYDKQKSICRQNYVIRD